MENEEKKMSLYQAQQEVRAVKYYSTIGAAEIIESVEQNTIDFNSGLTVTVPLTELGKTAMKNFYRDRLSEEDFAKLELEIEQLPLTQDVKTNQPGENVNPSEKGRDQDSIEI